MKFFKSLFSDVKLAWDKSETSSISLIKVGELYPFLYMPDDVASIVIEEIIIHKVSEKDQAKFNDWLRKNVQNLD